jgi:hypothetical protein
LADKNVDVLSCVKKQRVHILKFVVWNSIKLKEGFPWKECCPELGTVAVYEDEVDIHLNPKIGPDWMTRGQQKEVMTPGKNEKYQTKARVSFMPPVYTEAN